MCGSCKTSCCTNVADPLLFPTDLDHLRQINKLNKDFVREVQLENKSIKTIRRTYNSDACIFWDGEKKMCTIYEHRPFDCKMFPFDIDYRNGAYHWIVYSCNPDSDWSWAESHLKHLEEDPQFHELIENIEFFRLTAKNYVDPEKIHPTIVLRKVNLAGIH